jgi:hypothetical protein
MAAEFKIGRLRYNWTGVWTPGATYARDDVVLNDGKAWVCLMPGVASTSFYTDLYATFPVWIQMTAGKSWTGPWTPATIYGLGDIVIFGGKAYYCSTNHTSGSLFETNASAWTEYTEFANWHPSWASNTEYGINDAVRWGGIVYKCIANHVSAATYSLGLEANQAAWTVFYSGINYSGAWQSNYRYKLNDLVKIDGDIYKCTAYNTDATFTPSNWTMWLPGQMFDLVWSSGTTYQIGDAIVYGSDAYLSKTANNFNNNPATDSTNWGLFNVGYSIQDDWNSGTSYAPGNLVRRHGMLYEAVSNSSGQDPSLSTVITTYTASGSSGTTLVVASTTGIVPGMYVSSVGFTLGQVVSSVTNNTTLVLDLAPDGTLTDGQNINFSGVNSTYWTVLVTGKQWTHLWASNKSYVVGDIVVWKNGTFYCLADHLSVSLNYPGNTLYSTGSQVWGLLVAHNQPNALTTLGDLETFTTGPGYATIPVGTQSYNLRTATQLTSVSISTLNLGVITTTTTTTSLTVPNWQQINVIPAVYYVDTYNGIDRADYGITWDQPFKTIKYACNFIGQGAYFANATALLQFNKGWMITEMYQWMLYQSNNNISPFSTTSLFDPYYTQRDAGYIIDAIIYDMRRGGNSQTVAATLRFFFYGSQTQIVNSQTESVIAYIAASLNYLLTLMLNVVQNTSPVASYQQLNGVNAGSAISQYINTNINPEINTPSEINSLMSIIIPALTNQNTYTVPSSNSGTTAILNIKTGTYNESLPITVPENVSIVGDELRSTTVQPATSITINCLQTIQSTNTIVVTDASQLTDGMPLQFISPFINNASTTFGNVLSGQTYYVIGSSISGNALQLNDGPTFTFAGTSVLGSNILLNVNNISNLVVGMRVSGNGIPANSYVYAFSQAITSIATITLCTGYPLAGGYTFVAANAAASGILQTFTASGNLVNVIDGSGAMLVYAGDCLKNMWLLRNGTTMRNLSNFGLKGTLTQTNAYSTARPTGGAYTCFDSGTGPDDTSVWIFRRSPYIQNVTNFGDACSGMKVDGYLHNGGTKSMVTNDYTQVLNDGIGVWIRGPGSIAECVSVFSYYNYIGHFAEDGGRIRSTNGNSSYGTFGVVSEGFDPTEVPVQGTIFNQSLQVQAQVQNAFGTSDQLLKLNYSNAGSAYYSPATNMLQYSNLFTAGVWTNDGNVSFIKNEVAPTGFTEGWLLTGSSNIAGTGYIQQTVNINSSGYSYSNISGITQGGAPGNSATFDIVVISTAYTISVHSGSAGSQYQVGNTIVVKGSQLGGVDGINDLTVTVASLAGTGILTLNTPTGTVPVGSAQAYTMSIYVYPGTSSTVDLQAIFSGSTTTTSGISYNVSKNVVTPYSGQNLSNGSNGGQTPVYYGAQKTLVPGWYRIWLSVSDIVGTNTALTFKLFPQGANTPAASTYSIFYGSQLELSGSSPPPDFYLETTTGMFTAYANYEISGAGSGAVLSGDEVRSGAVFNARVTTDTNGYTGGSNYATSSNTAQGGTTTRIQLAQADPGLYNYVGMRVFINGGTGAGQYGYVSYYNGLAITDSNGIASKTALILQEEFDSLSITQTSYSSIAANNFLTLASGTDISKMYVNQPVMFTPTYYTSTVNTTSVGTINAISTVGGTTNRITVDNIEPLALNMPIVFSGSGFNVTPGYQYYIVFIDYANSLIQISATLYGDVIELSSVLSGSSMTITYPNYSGYLAANTINMIPNIAIQFTGYALGGLTLGTTYYIQDIIDSNNFTISSLLINLTAASTTGGATNAVSAPTSSLVPLTPVVFGGTIFDSAITSGQKYYINTIVDANNFTIATGITRTIVTQTFFSSNLITLNTVTNFVVGNPIIFSGIPSGQTFGGLSPETVYYIQTINTVTKQITVSATISGGVPGSAYALVNDGALLGNIAYARTCPSDQIVSLGGGSPAGGTSMTITSTATKLVVTNSVGTVNTMNSTFSTTIFGGVNSYTVYYITAITPGTTTTFSVATSLGGTPVTLVNGLGTMQLGAAGWDNINPGTPAATSLDTTSIYYIEPRTQFTDPTSSQAVGTISTPLANGVYYQQIAYGNNYFLAVPSAGQTGAQSADGSAWTALTLPSNIINWTSIAFGNFYWIAIGTDLSSNSYAAYSNSNGAGWRTVAMPSNTTWSSICYGNGIFVAIATGTSSAAYTTNFGRTWLSSSTGLLATKTWVGVSYGAGKFLATATDGTAAWSYDGNNWSATQLPQSTTNLSGVTISGGGGTFACTISTSQLLVGQTVVIRGTNGGTGAVTNGTYYIISTNGKSVFTLGATPGAGSGITTTAGSPSGLTFAVGAPAYTATAWGNNRFMATQSGTGLYPAYSSDGITWYQSNTYVSATAIASGQGTFIAVNSGNTTAYKSRGGLYWNTRTLTYGSRTCIAFGFTPANVGVFLTLAGTGAVTGNATVIKEGIRAQGRVIVASGIITAVSVWEPGSNYSTTPAIAFIDFNASVTATVTGRVANGALGNPTFVSRGQGYNTTSTTVTITGNGYSDSYQTGYTLIINNLSSLPIVGSNLSIAGNGQVYKVTSATAVYGTQAPFIEANVQVSPTMTTALSPANGTTVSVRQLYSQCRLTNHDFLSIGVGSRTTSGYPNINETLAKPQNQAVETNQGHVFYTSTDENGNFLVGGLFGVQQATGTVTLSATQFGLQGLQTLSLGGIAVGGASVIVTSFSTDSTFVANSDAVIPTQRAVKSYLTGRLSQGGANTYTGQLIAGTVEIGGAIYIKSSLPNGTPNAVVKMKNKVMIAGKIGVGNGAVDGNMAALDMFMRSANHR